MFAKNLSEILHRLLVGSEKIEETLLRFEKLRSYALLPRGQENAARRLNDTQIAHAVLAFAPILPGSAGHAALVLGSLCPVGGLTASFKGARNLVELIALLLTDEQYCSNLIALTLIIERDFGDYSYRARCVLQDGDNQRKISFVSKCADYLRQDGAENKYDHEALHSISARQLTLGREFFCT